MDLKGLEYIVLIADTGNVTRAAELAFVAQPSLSRKVAEIEKEFHVSLFTRNGHGMELTAAGHTFCFWAKQILNGCDILRSEMARLCHEKQVLRIVYAADGTIPYVAEVVNRVHGLHPELELYPQSSSSLAIMKGISPMVLEQLHQHVADIAFAYLPQMTPANQKWLDYRSVEAGGLCAFVGDAHPLLQRSPLMKADLAPYTLVMPPKRYVPELTEAMCKALGNPERVVYSEDSTGFRIRVIAEGAVGIMPISSRTIENHFLRCLPIADVTEGFDLVVAWRRSDQAEALKQFTDALL